MKDTEKKDKYKIYGELINTYGYGLEEGVKSFKALNYYTNEEITIPLDPQLTPQENSKKYFDRYQKLKRTQEALEEQIKETTEEIQHLESISNALDIAREESDLSQINAELTEFGYIKKHYTCLLYTSFGKVILCRSKTTGKDHNIRPVQCRTDHCLHPFFIVSYHTLIIYSQTKVCTFHCQICTVGIHNITKQYLGSYRYNLCNHIFSFRSYYSCMDNTFLFSIM